MQNQQEIYDYIKKMLVELFEIPAEDISPEASLYEDLDIDSIDAVDMMVEIKQVTGQRVDPEDFKHVRTVQDIVVALENLLKSTEQSLP